MRERSDIYTFDPCGFDFKNHKKSNSCPYDRQQKRVQKRFLFDYRKKKVTNDLYLLLVLRTVCLRNENSIDRLF